MAFAAGAGTITSSTLAFDDDIGSRWESAHLDEAWISVDLGQEIVGIERIDIAWEAALSWKYTLQFAGDTTGSLTGEPSAAAPALLFNRSRMPFILARTATLTLTHRGAPGPWSNETSIDVVNGDGSFLSGCANPCQVQLGPLPNRTLIDREWRMPRVRRIPPIAARMSVRR